MLLLCTSEQSCGTFLIILLSRSVENRRQKVETVVIIAAEAADVALFHKEATTVPA